MQQFISPLTILFTLATLLGSAVSASAAGIGRRICGPYKPLVVQITSQFAHGAQEHGFGFLVGEQDHRLYIVTANHVVRSRYPDNPTEQVLLRFSWDPGGRGNRAELLDTVYKPLDLALLRIDKRTIMGTRRVEWKGRTWCRRWQVEEKVWFIGRAQKWYVPPDQRAGILLRPEADLLGFIHIDIDSIQPGTSGAPLLIKNGLVGMVVNDSPEKAQAVNIDHIRRFVSVENPYPWNLVKYERNAEHTEVTSSTTSSRIKDNDQPNDQSPAKVKGDTVPQQNKVTKGSQVVSGEGAGVKILPYPQQLQGTDRPQGAAPAQQEAQTTPAVPPAPSPPKPGDMLFEPITKIELIRIPEGCFDMGSPKADKKRYNNEVPPHQVCMDAFWLGKYEVTLAQWVKIMGKKPRRSHGRGTHPAVPVTWEEAQEFISRLNEKTGLMFRLPTEAEWEYAARAGTSTIRHWGDDISCDQAMYSNDANENSCVDYVQQHGGTLGVAAPVGSYPRMNLVSMTCSVMSKNGAQTGMGKSTTSQVPKKIP